MEGETETSKISGIRSLFREQLLQLGDKSVTIQKTELIKSDFDSVFLIAEASLSLAGQLDIWAGQNSFSGEKLQCLYEGEECTAVIEALSRSEMKLSSDQLALHFVCSSIESNLEPGDQFEFFLPHVRFGTGDISTQVNGENGGASVCDKICFTIDSVEWALRDLIEVDGEYHTSDDAIRIQLEAGVQKLNLNGSGHVVLQVNSSGISREMSEEVASNVCWILQLAFAQRVAWSDLWTRTGSAKRFLCRRGVTLPRKASGIAPLRNWGNQPIKKYIESAYPIFKSDPKWWRETLHWYTISVENLGIESSSMIFCMLFDRVSSRLLDGHSFPKQIGQTLDSNLSDSAKRAELEGRLHDLLREFEPQWPDGKAASLVEKIKEWNEQPSYPNKIATAFALVA